MDFCLCFKSKNPHAKNQADRTRHFLGRNCGLLRSLPAGFGPQARKTATRGPKKIAGFWKAYLRDLPSMQPSMSGKGAAQSHHLPTAASALNAEKSIRSELISIESYSVELQAFREFLHGSPWLSPSRTRSPKPNMKTSDSFRKLGIATSILRTMRCVKRKSSVTQSTSK